MDQDLTQKFKEWQEGALKDSLKRNPECRSEFNTDSGIPVNCIYTPLDLERTGFDYLKDLGLPGQYPGTRGISPTMYRSAPWIVGQYGGFGDAEETNKWFKYLLEQGAANLIIALDLPTQIGYDSDHPMAFFEVGRVGVAISSFRDIEIIFDGLPFDKVKRLGSTANAIGPIFMAWIMALAEKRGVSLNDFLLRLQNDVLKEYISRNTHIFPPKYGLKFAGDVIEFGAKEGMSGNLIPLTLSGYHMSEAGATATQELAFTLANGIAYIEDILDRKLDIDSFAPNLMVFLGVKMDFFEEIAKFRACRRLWARLLQERFGAKNPQSMLVKLQAYTQGSTLTAQQPLNNVARCAIMSLAAALGGCQYLFVSSYDEALGLPTEQSAQVALRTQQIVAYETGIERTVDPMGGAYFIEDLTSKLESSVLDYMTEIESVGGAVEAIEKGYQQREIANSAYKWVKEIESEYRPIVGLNSFQTDESVKINVRTINEEQRTKQIQRLKALTNERDNRAVINTLREVKSTAKRNENTILPIFEAVKAYATIGEICDTLRDIWGEYRETAASSNTL
jgi:methylmalonyl-CoA mutase N-terminal domain/subunit